MTVEFGCRIDNFFKTAPNGATFQTAIPEFYYPEKIPESGQQARN
jgi:hypothetical protein